MSEGSGSEKEEFAIVGTIGREDGCGSEPSI